MPLPPTAVLTVSSGHLDAARCLHVAHRAPCLRNIMGFQRIPSDLSGFMWNVWGTLLRARITSCEQIDLQWNELLHNKVWMCMVVFALRLLLLAGAAICLLMQQMDLNFTLFQLQKIYSSKRRPSSEVGLLIWLTESLRNFCARLRHWGRGLKA